MTNIFEKIVRFSQQEKGVLLFGSGVGFIALVLMHWFGFLPLDTSWFVFCTVLVFLAALYRPAWVFLVLLVWLPLEVVTLAPAEFGGGWRPYQWLASVLLVALCVRKLTGRSMPSLKWHWLDGLLMVVPLFVIVVAFGMGLPGSFRLMGIFGVYVILYFLGRFFWRSREEIFAAVPFFVLGGVLSMIVGLAQVLLFRLGQAGFMVMPGRPNAVFAEPDWYGFFLLPVIALGYIFLKKKRDQSESLNFDSTFFQSLLLYFYLWLAFLSLVLTVSRSAWLGAGFLCIAFLFFASFPGANTSKKFQWREGLFYGNITIVLFGLAVMTALSFGLTRFDLGSRAASTATGFQKITLACLDARVLPSHIEKLDELAPLGCRFITLEEIPDRQNEGFIIQSILRPDPNVEIRKHIYQTSLKALSEHPFFGIGWGSIGDRLGRDDRGAALNASNIFLEVWLGAGFIGVLALVVFLLGGGVILFRKFIRSAQHQEITLFVILTLGGFLIFNLFNSGILLGWVWVFFSLLPTQANRD